jgi:hypothetical protein
VGRSDEGRFLAISEGPLRMGAQDARTRAGRRPARMRAKVNDKFWRVPERPAGPSKYGVGHKIMTPAIFGVIHVTRMSAA